MARISRRRLVGFVAVPVLASGLTAGLSTLALSGAAGTSALSQTVTLPGTPVSSPCSVTFSESINTKAIPPASATETGTCAI